MSLRPYLRLLATETQVTLAYRGSVLAYLSAVLIPPLAVSFLWRAVLGRGGSLAGYDLPAMVTYYIVVQYFVAHTPFSAWTEIGEEIRDGRLSLWLSRPLGHYGMCLARNLGAWIPYWAMGLVGAAAVAGILHRYFLLPGEPWRVPVAVGFWLLGVALAFTWGYTLNLLSFWTQRSTGIVLMADAVAVFLSGGLVPLDILPLKEVWLLLPFRFAGWLPTQIFLGRVGFAELPRELGLLLAWLLAFLLIRKLIWHLGLRRYQGAGG